MRATAPALAAILGLAPASIAGSAETLQLARRFRKGDAVSFRCIAVRKITRKLPEQEQRLTNTTGVGFTIRVQEVDADGTAVVTLTFDWAMLKLDGPGDKVEYDSAEPPAEVPRPAQHLAGLLGESFAMQVRPDGTIQDVRGVDDLIANAMTKLDADTLIQAEWERRRYKHLFSKAGIQFTLAGFGTKYPAEPVALGDSWSARSDLVAYSPIILDDTWTLKARKDGVATIGIRTKVTPHPTDRTIDAWTAKFTWDLSGHREGTAEVEEATGWPLRMKTSMALKGTLTVSDASGRPDESRSGPFQSTVEVTVERVKGSAPARPEP